MTPAAVVFDAVFFEGIAFALGAAALLFAVVLRRRRWRKP